MFIIYTTEGFLGEPQTFQSEEGELYCPPPSAAALMIPGTTPAEFEAREAQRAEEARAWEEAETQEMASATL